MSFNLKKGEILGIAGLVGAKRTDLVEAIFSERHAHGKIELHGKEMHFKNPQDAIKNGFALVTEERRATGIFPNQNISFNSIIANIDRYVKKTKLLDDINIKKDTNWVIDSMSVKTPSMKTRIMSLSGGNQQKVIIVKDVESFPGHIACDSRSKSEIVIPLRDNKNNIIGVLDVDSNDYSQFDEVDEQGLKKILNLCGASRVIWMASLTGNI